MKNQADIPAIAPDRRALRAGHPRLTIAPQ